MCLCPSTSPNLDSKAVIKFRDTPRLSQDRQDDNYF